MKNIFYTLLALSILVTSCDDDFLDRAPYNAISSSIIFNSDANAEMAINGVYNSLSRNSFNYDFYIYMSCLGPEGFGFSRADWGMSFSMGKGTSRDGKVTNIYRNFYRTIVYANEVISGLEGNTVVSEDLRTRITGEAKFMRGLCYFYLYNFFGGVVIVNEPILTDEKYLGRNTKEEVIAYVISDFTDAIATLPDSYSSSNLGRATKGAAIAMLGKTYLYNRQWAEAATQFEKLLAAPYSYDLVENFGDNFYWQTQNNKESVFELQYDMVTNLGSSFDNYFGNRSTGGISSGQDYCETSQRVFSAFTHNDGSPIDFSSIPVQSNYPTEIAYGIDLIGWYQTTLADVDKRLHQSAILPGATYFGKGDKWYQVYWPYSPYVNSDPAALRTTYSSIAMIPVRKFLTLGNENTLGRDIGPTNLPVIRFADVLLMYAEAKNETDGPVSGVYSAINRIKTRAGIVNADTGLSKDEMRREIWLERFRELMFENVLYFDVRRWNMAHTNDPVFGLNNDEWDFRLQTKHYTKAFNETRDYLWPIPGGEIDINSKMEQNPGW